MVENNMGILTSNFVDILVNFTVLPQLVQFTTVSRFWPLLFVMLLLIKRDRLGTHISSL